MYVQNGRVGLYLGMICMVFFVCVRQITDTIRELAFNDFAARTILTLWKEKLLRIKYSGKHGVIPETEIDALTTCNGVILHLLVLTHHYPDVPVTTWFLTNDAC